MLRYIYLLYLLVCIENVFCYNSESDGSDLKKRRVLKHRRIFKRQVYEGSDEGSDERGPVADIDVANFMQRPDYETLEDTEQKETGVRNKKHSSKDYGDYGPLAKLEEDNSERKDKIYLDDSHQEYELQDITSNVDNGPEENMSSDKARKAKKKSLLKRMKVPFFSHESDSTKTKKNKKRKLFKIRSKKKSTLSSSLPEDNTVTTKTSDLRYDLNKQKRSYQEHICSICKRKFLTSAKDASDGKNMLNNIIHNSRQYFQALEDKNKVKIKQGSSSILSEEEDKEDQAPDDETLQVNRERMKREEDDKERQLKELEEVRKKIDDVEINMYVYQKPG